MFTDILPVAKAELFDGIQKPEVFPRRPIASAIEYTNGPGVL